MYNGIYQDVELEGLDEPESLSEMLRQEVAQLRNWMIQLSAVCDLLNFNGKPDTTTASLQIIREGMEKRANEIENLLVENRLLNLFPED